MAFVWKIQEQILKKIPIFQLDILSLLPLDLLYFVLGTEAVYVRFPRLLKIQSFWEVFKLLDRVISSPHFVSMNFLTGMRGVMSAN